MESSLSHEDSQTFISLTELDPSPIESPTPLDESEEFIMAEDGVESSSSTIKASTTMAPGLNSNNGSHGSLFYCMNPKQLYP